MIFSKINVTLTVLASGIFSLLCSSYDSTTDNKYTTVTIKANQQTDLQKSIANGKEVYADFCMQCHKATGNGSGRTYPPLDGSDWLKNKRTASIHAVKYGLKGAIVVNGQKYSSTMSPMGLSDEEVADVMNYIMNSWSNKQTKMVTVAEVALVKK
jgi:mono/diheme cytochrome c family protein